MKLGLKLWSNNIDNYLKEAEKLYKQGVYDYIELYVVPNTLETIPKWKNLNTELDIPFTLHAPHFIHDINLADKSKEKYNTEVFKQVEEFSNELNATYTVVHSGIEGNIDETIRQLKIISASYPPLEGGSKSLISGRGGIPAQYTENALGNSKNLRKNMTGEERILWRFLKNHQLDNLKFRRQQPIGKYIVDFVCFEKKLVIELDGSGHNGAEQILYDVNRDEFLKGLGYTILRFWNNEIYKNIDGIIEKIFEAVNNPLSSVLSLERRGRITKKILIENKPFVAPLRDNRICRGATIEEISKVIDEIGCGFCLDVGHAICTANTLKIEPYEYISQFNELNPTCYHLSDNFIDSEIDKHLNFGQGNYDFKKIFDIIDTNKNIAIETNKKSKENIDDFIEDVKWLKNL